MKFIDPFFRKAIAVGIFKSTNKANKSTLYIRMNKALSNRSVYSKY